MESANIIVIGGGVVGLSVAASLSERNEGVYVFEKNRMIGRETSSHNSGVIHSGIHYPKRTLKALLSVKGNSMTYELSRKYGIGSKRLGKLTVATGDQEIRVLDRLMRNGEDNGVEGLRLLDREEIRQMEPNVVAEKALYTPSTGIIEPDELMQHFHAQMANNGAILATGTEVTGLENTGSGYRLTGMSAGEKFTIGANAVINCAGLHADMVAAMAGLDIDKLGYRQRYYKGDYFRIAGTPPVRMLVYPVPSGAGLGIHLTPDMAGSVKMGPNAYPVGSIDYRIESDKEAFRRDVGRFLPSILDKNIQPDSSGIRPKLDAGTGNFADFIIRHETERGLHGFINLIGIESPGLTASPAIGEYVCGIYENEVKT